jgi:hypothetical protein
MSDIMIRKYTTPILYLSAEGRIMWHNSMSSQGAEPGIHKNATHVYINW